MFNDGTSFVATGDPRGHGTPEINSSWFHDDFLLNVVAASKVMLDVQRRQWKSGSYGDTTSSKGVYTIEPYALLGNLYIHEEREQVLNYATLGTSLLRNWFMDVFNELKREMLIRLDEFLLCEKGFASLAWGNNVTTELLMEWIAASWSLNVAYHAMASKSIISGGRTFLRDQMFFRWYCHVFCGAPEMAAVCNHAVSQSEAFIKAFRCENLRRRKC